MNLRNWSREHTFGLLLGILTTIVCVPIVLQIFEAIGDHQLWFLEDTKSRVISLASIGNLPAFHLLMRNKKYDYCMGLILATFLSLFVMFYYKF